MSSVLATLVPAVAVILSNIQLASPLKAVLICRRLNELGSMNPVPWGVSFINCIGYMLYGTLIKDPFVMCSVTLGLPANYFAISSALSILGKTGKGSENHTTWKLEYVVVSGLAMWIFVAFVVGAILPAIVDGDVGDLAINIVGYVCIATCLLYYLAPLSVLMEIIKNKDAAGLYTPMVVMNLLTSTTWAAYGFIFIGDVVVYSPNMFAMLISCAQLYLKFAYPSIDPTKLQRRMTVDNGTDSGEPEPYRHRTGTIVQDVLCGDGTIGVIEFTEEEAATRMRRSSTVASFAERLLDVIDIVGPRRIPIESSSESQGPNSSGSSDGDSSSVWNGRANVRMRVNTSDGDLSASSRSRSGTIGRQRMGSEPIGVSLPAIAEEGGISEEHHVSSGDEEVGADVGSSYTYGQREAGGVGVGVGALRNDALPGVDDTVALLPQEDQSGSILKSLSGLADTVYGVRSRSSTRTSQQYQYVELQDQSEGAAVGGVSGSSPVPDSV
eukprot:CAMPEP_0170400168 /NCGR_PEP_ID=MMETSP0117_2-20130122/24356_1 /TAXON_ID=400756 /ORGANISM="Durinskia baltica, Strain CSIRO CS-38" /LENGTH=496 /DNA_ID=CAMNT_0010656903 /DNA_START=29 /DNA_END=1519 /DNA_ORIENTATION=+